MTDQHQPPRGRGVTGALHDGKDIPPATVSRLATYLRVLGVLVDAGRHIVSSEELATAAGVNSAKLRKDLSFLGPSGVRGVGYDVAKLRSRIERALGLEEGHRVVLVGAGNLGRALAGYGGFARRGFTMVGLFDNNESVIGSLVGTLRVRDVAELAEACTALEPTIAVVAVPDDAAQVTCDRLVAAGLRCLLSFSPVSLDVPDHVEVRRIDLAVEMQMLSFRSVRNADSPRSARPDVGPANTSPSLSTNEGSVVSQ